MPGFVDYDLAMYGTGDLDELGVKVALDKEGPPLDPDAELPAAGATEPAVREYLARRFPALADAPLKEGRCCRYELSADSNFIAARHPELERTWIARRRLGPRLQARPRARRAASPERCAAASRCPRASASATATPGARSAPPAQALRRSAHGDEPGAVVHGLAAAELLREPRGREPALVDAVARAVVELALLPGLGLARRGAAPSR